VGIPEGGVNAPVAGTVPPPAIAVLISSDNVEGSGVTSGG